MVKVWTSPRSFYWAWFVDVHDSTTLVVRCVSHDHEHLVSKERVR